MIRQHDTQPDPSDLIADREEIRLLAAADPILDLILGEIEADPKALVGPRPNLRHLAERLGLPKARIALALKEARERLSGTADPGSSSAKPTSGPTSTIPSGSGSSSVNSPSASHFVSPKGTGMISSPTPRLKL